MFGQSALDIDNILTKRCHRFLWYIFVPPYNSEIGLRSRGIRGDTGVVNSLSEDIAET
jgi:hypothetical protein